MNEWIKMVSCSDREFEGLHDELRSGGGLYIFDSVRMPESCNNAECTIEFRYYGENKISVTCVQAPVPYTGNNGHIALWLEQGIVEFESFDEMKGFLREFKRDINNNSHGIPSLVVSAGPGNEAPGELTGPVPTPPEMRYDRENLTVPETNQSYIRIDRDKLIIELNKEFFGMEENILKIAHLVCNHISTKGKDKPLTIFLYGPPATGKSNIVKELVKAINRQLDKSQHFIYRDIDCAHLKKSEDVSKIIGTAPGYVGFDEPCIFAPLEDNPNAVFVFEEIDMASKSVTEVIMQAMETGRQSTNGKTLKNGAYYYDLSNSIIFFTSNIKLDENAKMEPAAIKKTTLPESPAEIARLISRESTEARERLLESERFNGAVISRINAIFKFNKPDKYAIIDIAAKFIRNLASDLHKLYISEIETPILQEFINAAVSGSETFNPRVLREEAKNFFNYEFAEYSHTHDDYSVIVVSGCLDNVIISPGNT